MKRFFISLLVVALTACCLTGVTAAQAEKAVWNFGAWFAPLDADGNVIFHEPCTVEKLCNGFQVRITSDMEEATDSSLLIVYGNTVLPFYVDYAENTVLQYDWRLGAKEETVIYVQLEKETLEKVAESGHCLNLVFIGLQDSWNVTNDLSPIWYDISYGILIGEEEEDANTYVYSNMIAPFMRVRTANGEEIENERRLLNVFDVSSTQPEITFEIGDSFENLAVIPMVNRRLVMQEDGTPLVAHAAFDDGIASGEMVLPLEPGENEVCFLTLPADGEASGGHSTSYKYLITAPEDTAP